MTWHKGRGTAGRWAVAPRLRLYERNALAMIYKNYSDETLARVAPVAISLALSRALAGLDIDPALYVLGRRPPERADVPARTIAQLLALEDFGSRLSDLSAKRHLIQARRRRSDQELWPLFGDPFKLHETGGTYERVARALIADFGVDTMIAGGPAMPERRGGDNARRGRRFAGRRRARRSAGRRSRPDGVDRHPDRARRDAPVRVSRVDRRPTPPS